MLICNCVISHQNIENENRKDKKMGRNRKRKCSACKKRGELTSVKGTVMCFPCAIAISKMRTRKRISLSEAIKIREKAVKKYSKNKRDVYDKGWVLPGSYGTGKK